MRKHPHLMEMNAFFFISRMSEKYGRKLTLSTVPVEEWQGYADRGFDYIWLMGVWRRSPGSRAHAMKEPNLCRAYDLILPDWKKEDVAGSPYAIFGYELDPFLGSPDELLKLKMLLNGLGIGLILDFVPNHLAFDHPWTVEHPEYFVSCKPQTHKAHADWFFTTPDGKKLAHGRDPFFAPWIDTVQVNYWSEELRAAWLCELLKMTKCADGVRCDMAMLGLNDVFQGTWGEHIADRRPATEFWGDVIEKVKERKPHFLFIAEVYWDMDWTLQQLGFDFTYDKRLYDRLFYDSPISVRDHLKAEVAYRDKCLRFVENHDEERASVIFGQTKSQAAGVVISTIPGLRFFYDGQLEGRRIRTPVHLRREPKEPAQLETADLYKKLLSFTHNPVIHDGQWTLLLSSPAWIKNDTYLGILCWVWCHGNRWKLIVINYSMLRAQSVIFLPENLCRQVFLQLRDVLTGKLYDRTGEELMRRGFYIDLLPWQSHLFDIIT